MNGFIFTPPNAYSYVLTTAIYFKEGVIKE